MDREEEEKEEEPKEQELLEADLLKRAREWAAWDPNPTSSNYVVTLCEQAAAAADDAEDAAAAACRKELRALFPAGGNRIEFGTAGLRSGMKPGPLGMNDLVVLQAAQGIAKYCCLLDQQRTDNDNNNTKPRVVIGYDHRANPSLQLSSLSFALLSTLVFQAAGYDVLLLDGFVATPLVPFCLSHPNDAPPPAASSSNDSCDEKNNEKNKKNSFLVGIMITASHNPKQDAGYKVYWHDGCQIRSPMDTEIAHSILQNLQPWKDYQSQFQQLQQQQQLNNHNNNIDPCLGLSCGPTATQQLIHRYGQAIQAAGLVTGQAAAAAAAAKAADATIRLPKFCYTAMHGVGYRFVEHVFTNVFHFASDQLVSVPSQQDPDPEFPSVVFPNPEEAGALDWAMECAVQNNCCIVVANDPDADRLAVAEYDPNNNHQKWTVFTGDQIGSLLGHWLFQNYYQTINTTTTTTTKEQQQSTATPPSITAAMCASTVSSKLLAEIARKEGFYFEDTLTGFKWIGSRSKELDTSSSSSSSSSSCSAYKTLFCYEEAIGFCCVCGSADGQPLIFDKDGVCALGVFCELATWIYCNKQQTVASYLQHSLYDTYGEFVSNNGYFFVSHPALSCEILTSVAANNGLELLLSQGITVENSNNNNKSKHYTAKSIRYLGEPGFDSSKADKRPTLPTSKSSPMLTLTLEDPTTNGGCTVVAQFRGSGTEPKLKYYIEFQGAPGGVMSKEMVQEELNQVSAVLIDQILQPTKYGLKLPTVSHL